MLEARAADLLRLPTAEVHERLLRAVDGCERLPVLDRALRRVLDLAEREEAGTGELADAMEADAGLATNVLRYANSAAVARPMRVRTVRHAVVLVGRRGVRRLALDSVAFRFFERAPGNGRASRGQLHLHAVQVAQLAVLCAERAGIPADVPHLAGLLHDCGKLVLPMAFGEDPVDAIALAEADGHARARLERRELGADHAQAGALLAAASGVDEDVQRAIAWHHGGHQGVECPDVATACVQLANAVCGALAGRPLDDALCDVALRIAGLPEQLLDELAERASVADQTPAAASGGSTLADLERLAHTDELTGVANRRRFLSVLRERLAEGDDGALVLLDVDHFKRVNDHHGHGAGDLVLLEVARLAAGHGFAGRLGGDELALWVTGEGDAAARAAQQLVDAVRGTCAGGSAPVTVSAGVAEAGPVEDLTALLERADRALYAAKAGGRDRVVVAAG